LLNLNLKSKNATKCPESEKVKKFTLKTTSIIKTFSKKSQLVKKLRKMIIQSLRNLEERALERLEDKEGPDK
jgi:hypothetical protein